MGYLCTYKFCATLLINSIIINKTKVHNKIRVVCIY